MIFNLVLFILLVIVTIKLIATWTALNAYILFMVSKGIRQPTDYELKECIIQVIKKLSGDVKSFFKLKT